MEAKLFTSVLIFTSVSLFAQTSLTHNYNALTEGDSFAFREVQFTDPGNEGANQNWDFSKIQYTGKNQVSTIQASTSQKKEGAGDYNLSLNENGYDYFMKSSEDKLEECGYENKELKLTLIYSDPVLKMKYPFSYGEYFTDHFIGVALFNETNKIDFFGDCSVSADGYGTLILPDLVVQNALRVKSIKKGLQINMCGTTDVNIIKYSWYASGYRYPVLSMSIVETRSDTGATVYTKSAFTNTEQINFRSAALGPDIQGKSLDAKQIEKQDVSVITSPNPFNDNLFYSYLLSEKSEVSIELYDMKGKYCGCIVKNQVQEVGLHRGELDALKYSIAPGVYFLRFTFDKQVVICKVVKI